MLKITIEGPQGSGKTKVARVLFAILSQVGGYVVEFHDGSGDHFVPGVAEATAIIETKQTPV